MTWAGTELCCSVQGEGTPAAGRGAVACGTTTSTGQAWLPLPGEMPEEIPKEEGLWGTATVKGLD